MTKPQPRKPNLPTIPPLAEEPKPLSRADLDALAAKVNQREAAACWAEIEQVLFRHGFELEPEILLGKNGVKGTGFALARKGR